MIVLDKPNKTFQISLLNATMNNELPFTCSYRNVPNGKSIEEGTLISVSGTTNGTGNVIVMPAPPAGTTNQLSLFTLINNDTARNVVTLYLYDGSTFTPILWQVMRVGRTLFFPKCNGFELYTPSIS
jgi:hypothetical protein